MRNIVIISIGFLIGCCSSAFEREDPFSSVRFLRNDAPNLIHTGDTIGIMYSHNSCCKFCWQDSGQLRSQLPESPLLKVIFTKDVPGDPDCAGCSHLFYVYYRAEKTGSDTITNLSLPMGMSGGHDGSCEEISADTSLEGVAAWKDYINSYAFRVLE